MKPVINETFNIYYQSEDMNSWMNERVGEGYEPFSIVPAGDVNEVLVCMVNPSLVRASHRIAQDKQTEARWAKLDAENQRFNELEKQMNGLEQELSPMGGD